MSNNNKEIQNQSRRSFVKTSATIAAGGTLLGSLPMVSFGAAPQSDLKIGLVGCGGRGTGAAHEALKTAPNVKLVAMGEVFEDRLSGSYQRLKSTFDAQVQVPSSHQFIGFDAYQKVIDKCDVVILATPPPFRPIHLEAAIKANKHVFVEKPLFVDVPGYHKIMECNELARQKNLHVAVGLQLRYETGFQQMMDKIREGAIGTITSLDVYYNVGAPKIHPRQPEQTEMGYQMRNWRYFTWLWGGQMAGQAIHQIDVMNWLMDDFPVTVNGMGGRQVFSGPNQGNTYDHHYAEFEYANKVKLHVQCRNINENWTRQGFHIQGTNGYADEKSRIYDPAGKIEWRYRDRDETIGSSQRCQSLFINSVLDNQPVNHLEYGAKSTLTTVMGRMAVHSGQVITLDQALTSQRSILPTKFTWDADMPDKPGADGNYAIPMPGKTQVL
ncbi:MAG: Gfo/Idh/MocA family oxidoreductase [Cyclobacteriaceae bacterium]